MTTTDRTVDYDTLTRCARRLVDVGIPFEAAFLAAGRYLTSGNGWGSALMDARREGLCSSAAVLAATRILESWAILA